MVYAGYDGELSLINYIFFLTSLFSLGIQWWVGGERPRAEEVPLLVEESKVQLSVIEISSDVFSAVYAKQSDKQTSLYQASAMDGCMPNTIHFSCLIEIPQ